MRLGFCLTLVWFAVIAPAQVWEKLVAPGVTYRMEVDLQTPRVVHAIRWSPGAPDVRAIPEVAYQRVLADQPDGGRQTVAELVAQSSAIGGINADFFPPRADPLGVMVRDGEVISQPWPRRAGFAWGPGGAMGAIWDWSGRVTLPGGAELNLQGINQECGDNDLVLVTDDAARAIAIAPSRGVRLSVGSVLWRPGADVEAEVVETLVDAETRPMAAGEAYLLGRGAGAQDLAGLRVGDRLRVRIDLAGFDPVKTPQAVGGGPWLVRDGKPSIDWDTAGFRVGFAENRHPRTAVGRTLEGDLWWVVIDGRQPMSVGATLAEAADLLVRLGCVEAVNLDGGGSSTLHLLGVTLNRPSDGQERKVANAVLFFAPQPGDQPSDAVIQGPARVALGAQAAYQVIGPDGKPIPPRDVLWSAMGAAWIDQGGTLRALREGAATIRASVRGRVVTLSVTVGG